MRSSALGHWVGAEAFWALGAAKLRLGGFKCAGGTGLASGSEALS